MITFGIITNKFVDYRILSSIMKYGFTDQKDNIIIVGGNNNEYYSNFNLMYVSFNEIYKNNDKKKGWITRKKNIITENSNNDIIVYMHDYIALHPGWRKGFDRFNKEYAWDVAMNRINNTDNTRYRDWVIWDDPDYTGFPQTSLPSYNYNKTQYMYISGAYWVAKKYVMQDLPLNEDLYWCDGEDVEWSKRMINKYRYVFNPYSQVNLLKYKDVISRKFYD